MKGLVEKDNECFFRSPWGDVHVVHSTPDGSPWGVVVVDQNFELTSVYTAETVKEAWRLAYSLTRAAFRDTADFEFVFDDYSP